MFSTATPMSHLAVGIADFEDHVFVFGLKDHTALVTVAHWLVLPPKTYKRLFLARIISRIDEVDTARPHELNLHDRFLIPGPGVMGVVRR